MLIQISDSYPLIILLEGWKSDQNRNDQSDQSEKSHHLCIFGYYFAVTWLREWHAEVQRFFNLTN